MSVNLGGMQSLSLLSGTIDYSQIVQQLYAADRAPGDALNQNIQDAQLKKNDWTQISSLASSLQDALVALADQSTFSSFTTTLSGTDPTAISATAGTTATVGTYNVLIPSNGVGSNATFTSASPIGKNPDLVNTQVGQQVWSQPISSGYVTVTVGNTSQQISIASTDTINGTGGIISKINSAFSSTYSQIIDPTSAAIDANGNLTFKNVSGQKVTFGTAGDTSNFFQTIGLAGVQNDPTVNATVASTRLGHAQLNASLQNGNYNSPVTLPNGATQGTLTINNVSITYQLTDTLQSVINNINSSKAGVTASYDPIQDKVTLTSKTSQPITVSDTTGTLGAALGLNGTSSAGTLWQYSLDGGNTFQTSDSAQVANAIPGVTFTIQSAGNATLTVASDTSKLTTNVQNFVKAFNSLYGQLQTNTKKGAALQGDAAMDQLGFRYMSDVLTNNLPNVPSQYAGYTVFDIGIDNGKIGSAPGTTNQLEVDTDKLVAAFQSDPNKVSSLLQGMATQLNNDLTNLTGNFNTLTPITSLNSSIIGIAQSEENMYDNMITSFEKQQQRIYDEAQQQEQVMSQQFTQLQQYQSQMSTQSSFFRAMLGG